MRKSRVILLLKQLEVIFIQEYSIYLYDTLTRFS